MWVPTLISQQSELRFRNFASCLARSAFRLNSPRLKSSLPFMGRYCPICCTNKACLKLLDRSADVLSVPRLFDVVNATVDSDEQFFGHFLFNVSRNKQAEGGISYSMLCKNRCHQEILAFLKRPVLGLPAMSAPSCAFPLVPSFPSCLKQATSMLLLAA